MAKNSNSIRSTISFDINLNEITSINEFCKKASREEFPIDVVSGRYVVNAKSIMALFGLDLSKPVTCTVHADDDTAARFLEAVKAYMV